MVQGFAHGARMILGLHIMYVELALCRIVCTMSEDFVTKSSGRSVNQGNQENPPLLLGTLSAIGFMDCH